IGGLFGEEGQMAEGGEAAEELHLAPGQRPGVLQLARKPPSAGLVLVAGIENRVRARPLGFGPTRGPQALRFRPDDAIGAEAFELAPAAAVDHRIIYPRRRTQNRWSNGDIRKRLDHELRL